MPNVTAGMSSSLGDALSFSVSTFYSGGPLLQEHSTRKCLYVDREKLGKRATREERDQDLGFVGRGRGTSIAMASKILLIVVFVFNVIAFALAVAAEQRRSTATIRQDTDANYNYCVYDSDISTGYGVGAFLLFMASQVVIMVASQCFCCGKPLKPGGSRALALILFIICWVFFIIAEVCLLAGSVRNAYHTKYRAMFTENPPSCQTLRKGVFAAGAAFIFLNSIVLELYYVFFSNARESFQPYGGEPAVSMGTYK